MTTPEVIGKTQPHYVVPCATLEWRGSIGGTWLIDSYHNDVATALDSWRHRFGRQDANYWRIVDWVSKVKR